METLVANLMGGALLITAALMFRWHWNAWQAAEAEAQTGESPDPAEFRFYRQQFRRRMQMSVMLGIVAMGLLASQHVDAEARPTLFVVLWAGLALTTMWVALLALVDLMAIRRNALRLTTRLMMQQGDLQAQIRKLKSEQSRDTNGNGHGQPPIG